MSILTDTALKSILCTNEKQWNQQTQLLIQGYDENCLTPIGYDLRVGGFYKTFINKPNLITLKEGEQVTIKPRDIALIGTCECIKMPQNGSISALILYKVSKVAKGLSHISTKVDPGWAEGELLIPVQNLSLDSVALDYQETFCTILFIRNEGNPSSLYNSSASRLKFFRLLAQVRKQSFWKEIRADFIQAIILIVLLVTVLFINKIFEEKLIAYLAIVITVGVAFSTALKNIISNYLDYLDRK